MTDAAAQGRLPEPVGLERHLTRAHAWAGVMTGLAVTAPTSIAELAIVPTAVVFLVGIPWTFRLWKDAWRRPVGALLLAFAAWLAIGLAWSPDRALGIEEFGTLRFALVVFLLVPALRRTSTGRGSLIAALAAGFLVGNAVQALNAWAVLGGGPEAFLFGREQNRLSGWWDPAVAGTILTAALGLHLPPALMGRGRARWIALACAGVTIAGLLATGSRGGWVASAALLTVAAAVAITRAVRAPGERLRTLAGLGVLVSVLGLTGAILREPIAARVQAIPRSLEGGADQTADGARLTMKIEAARVFLDRPLLGAGTGGYATRARAGADANAQAIHDHAHDTLLHAAASGGLPGVGLLVALGVAAIRGGSRWARVGGLGTYEAGPLFALVGLVFATPFDTLQVSASAAAVGGFILALCASCPRDGEAQGAVLTSRWP
jgi:hypothetical protein